MPKNKRKKNKKDKSEKSQTDASSEQADEIEALKAIFTEDFEERKPVWNCGNFAIQVRPYDVPLNKIFSKVKVSIRYTVQYPLKPPVIGLEDVVGLSEKKEEELLTLLCDKAQGMVGIAMVHSLITIAEEFLTVHNNDPKISLNDVWREREIAFEAQEREREIREDEERQAEEKLKAAEEAEKTQQLEQILEAEFRRKRDARRSFRSSSVEISERTGPLQDNIFKAGDVSDDSDSSDEAAPCVTKTNSLMSTISSRYASDFKEIRLLGKGGFGEVVLVKNRLDKRLYAVKKIQLEDNEEENRKIRREVTTISRMFHHNIVRYYQAWKEGGGEPEDILNSDVVDDIKSGEEVKSELIQSSLSSAANTDISDSDDEEEGRLGLGWFVSPKNVMPLKSHHHEHAHVHTHHKHTAANGALEDSQSSSSSYSSSESEDAFSEAPHLARLASFGSEFDLGFNFDAELEREDKIGAAKLKHSAKQSPIKVKKKTPSFLFIQMEYCEKTLRELIENELWKSPDEGWRLLRQMLDALIYIHKEGILHRDLKPANIFLDTHSNIKIGDFGLAAHRKTQEKEDTNDDNMEGINMEGMWPSCRIQSKPTHIKFGENETSELILVGEDTSQTWDDACSMTGGIGTAFYRAPEQETSSRYDFKADMFSLGIIFYEMMAVPFRTAMERAELLTSLRNTGIIHEDFARGMPENAVKVIQWLVQKSPDKRPTAKELLSSELLPSKMEVETQYLHEVMSILSNPQSSSYKCIINALFDQNVTEQKEVGYDYDFFKQIRVGAEGFSKTLIVREKLCTALRQLFASHGAVSLTPPMVRPASSEHDATKNDTWNASQKATQAESRDRGGRHWVSLVDKAGNIISLPSELTSGFARFAARSGFLMLKRYTIAPTFIRSDAAPKENMEAAFDVLIGATGSSSVAEAAEAEVLVVATQVMRLAAPFLFPCVMRLSHSRLCLAIFDLCGVQTRQRKQVFKLWHRVFTRSRHVEHTNNDLSKIIDDCVSHMKGITLPKEVIANLKPFFTSFMYTPTQALQEIENQVNKLSTVQKLKLHHSGNSDQETSREYSAARRSLKAVLEAILHLKKLVQVMQILGLVSTSPGCNDDVMVASETRPRSGSITLPFTPLLRVQIDLGLNHRSGQFCGGMLFQLLSMPGTPADKLLNQIGGSGYDKNCLAEGGRYEELVNKSQNPSVQWNAPPLIAVGVRFAVEKMVACLCQLHNSLQTFPAGSSNTMRNSTFFSGVGSQLDVLVSSGSGLDPEGVVDRLLVAQHLWNAGFRAEYLPKDRKFGPNADSNLDHLLEQCARDGVPYVVIVKSHIFKQRRQVKLCSVLEMGPGEMLELEQLSKKLQEKLQRVPIIGKNESFVAPAQLRVSSLFDASSSGLGTGPASSYALMNHYNMPNNIYVLEKSGQTEKKRGLKENGTLHRRITQALEAIGFHGTVPGSCHLHGTPVAVGGSISDFPPVLVSEVSFEGLREYSSAYMSNRLAAKQCQKAINDVIERHAKYRKAFKALHEAVLNFEDQINSQQSNNSKHTFRKHQTKTVLLYSIPDDRVDILYLTNPPITALNSNKSSKRGISR